MIKPPPDYRRKIAPNRVFFTWDITYKCNYRCTYCHFNELAGWKEPEATVNPGLERWVEIWTDIYEKYGSCEIHFAGGEPFVYPNFMDLIEKLSKMHTLEFSTNLHWEPEDFIRRIRLGRARIGVSFHPEFADFGVFFKKASRLKKAGFEVWANYVAYPPIFKGMCELKEKFKQAGIIMSILPFKGEFKGQRYPDSYSEAEKEYLTALGTEPWTQKTMAFALNKENRDSRDKLCRMGQMYAKIHSNGDAFSCCAKSAKNLGNLIAGTFSLLEEPFHCLEDNCPCWRAMIIGEEGCWSAHWVVPADARNLNGMDVKEDNNIQEFKVGLIQGPVWGIFDPPVALAQLSGCLRQKGLKVQAFDLNIELYRDRREDYLNAWAIEQSGFWTNEKNVKKFFSDNHAFIERYIDKIIETKLDLIGFSVNTCSLLATMELARTIKKKLADVKIVIGGPIFFVPADEEAILNDGSVDIIVRGEGEETLIELIEIFKNKADLAKCRGIVFMNNGEIIRTELRPQLKNLDDLPFLDFTDLPLDRYDPPGHLGRHISLMASRGCVQNCVFCGPRAYNSGYRSMSGRRIYEEIKFHLQNNPEIEHIEFLDLLLNGNINALKEFCELVILNPIKPALKWHANAVIRPEMTPEVLLKMKQAGCRHLTYGIESGSQDVLHKMRKHYKISDADAVLKNTSEAGIEVTCNFMFGFPGETEKDFRKTLDFLRRNHRYITVAYPSRTYCTIEPHSYLEKYMDQFGVIPNPENNIYWESKDGENTFPERMRRCEEFSSLAHSLGVSIGSGLQTSIELDRWYNLGFYYKSKNDRMNAINCFTNYLSLDSKNATIINALAEIRRSDEASLSSLNEQSEKVKLNGQVSFNWDIHWVCNYRCPYCWFYGKWVDLRSRNKVFSLKELIKAWHNIYKSYGKVKISITGGEPFIYPNFTDLIKEISIMHEIQIITNLSTDIHEFVRVIDRKNVKVNPSFHPLFADFDNFIKRTLLLKESGLMQCVSYLSWPPQIPKVRYYTDKFLGYGILISLQSFFGEYNGIKYPDGYTEDEKQIILPQIGKRGGMPFQIEAFVTKGKICLAGKRYGVIHPDGTVLRCGGINPVDKVSVVGNLFKEDFRLYEQGTPCTFEVCPCNEWAFLLQTGEESREKV